MGGGSSSELGLQLWSAASEEEEQASCSRILCYGDSLTAGFYSGGTAFSPYGRALQEALKSLGFQCEVRINGLSGHRADQMLAELDTPVCRDMCGKPGKGLAHILDNDGDFDLVIIMAGTNDFTTKGNLAPIKQSVCQLHEACHARGVPTMMLAAPCNTRNLQVGLSQLLRAWADNQDDVLAFIDPEEVLPRRSATHWERDLIHFSPSGSRALGLYLAPVVSKILKSFGQQPVKTTGPSSSPQLQPNPCAQQKFPKTTNRHGWVQSVPLSARYPYTPRYVAHGGA